MQKQRGADRRIRIYFIFFASSSSNGNVAKGSSQNYAPAAKSLTHSDGTGVNRKSSSQSLNDDYTKEANFTYMWKLLVRFC
jgi:hypothetical protein